MAPGSSFEFPLAYQNNNYLATEVYVNKYGVHTEIFQNVNHGRMF
jgi:hypothetical protein